MGRVKDWIFEQEMIEQNGAEIGFVCPSPECSNWIQQYNEIPYPDLSAEKQSDIAQTDDIEIVCDSCHLTINGSITNNSAFVSVNLPDYPDLDIEVNAPDQFFDDPFEDYLPPRDPYSVAKEAIGYLMEMIGSKSPSSDEQFTNRLVFSGAISMFEAYLGDTLINEVQNRPEVRNNLLKSNKLFGDLKVSAADFSADREVFNKHIIRELKGILYHNLRVVAALYKDALSVSIIPEKEHRDTLYTAVLRRHDCVHRNGQDKDGSKLDCFSDAYVSDVLNTVVKIIDHINSETELSLF